MITSALVEAKVGVEGGGEEKGWGWGGGGGEVARTMAFHSIGFRREFLSEFSYHRVFPSMYISLIVYWP